MSDATDVDPDELRTDLDHIKDALGLEERRPSWPREWLLFGLAVGLASLLSQVVALRGLPGYYHSVAWAGLIGAAWIAGYWLRDDAAPTGVDRSDVPGVGFVWGAVVAAAVALSVLLAPVLSVDAVDGSAVLFGMILILVGTSYLLVGHVLRAHRIRRRDRLAFVAGGVWMLPLGAAVAHVDFLQTYVYGVYGGLYVAYALASYWALARS